MTALLWTTLTLSLGWVVFAYAGYPVLLMRRRGRPIAVSGDSPPEPPPPISVIIAVHNGVHEIGDALERMLAQDYAGEREILVASDASDDGTDEVVLGFADRGVRLVRSEPRGGKETAQAAAIREARGEILVFCDVGSLLVDGALAALIAPFADPEVGSVSSEDHVESSDGEGAYVRYEMWLRRKENEITGLVGLSGSFFAARRALCDPWPTDLASDFRTALETARRGLRAVSAPDARVGIRTVSNPRSEWHRKVRTVRRGIAVLEAYRDLLVPGRSPVTLALWGHKLARFTAPFALVAVLLTNLALAGSGPIADALLIAQAIAYGAALLGLVWSPSASLLPVRIASFFVLVNASMLVAWGYHLTGQRSVSWTPTAR